MKKPSEQHSKSVGSLMYLFLLAFALITLLGACSLQEDKQQIVGTELWETTDSFEVLPTFLDEHSEHTTQLYSHVHEHTHVMGMIDCYCGCMEDNGIDEPHDSLLRCYITEHPTDDGTVTWTDHSTMCGICKQEMEVVIEMKNQGSSDDDVIAAVKDKFSHQ